MTVCQIPDIPYAWHHIPLKVEPAEALVNIPSQEIVEQLVELSPLHLLERLLGHDHLNYRDAQHAWVELLVLDEQPGQVEQAHALLLHAGQPLFALTQKQRLVFVQHADLCVPLGHGDVHEVAGCGYVHIPGDGIIAEDSALHLQDFVAGLGVVGGLGEVLDSVHVDLLLLGSDL